ncbi:MAG TPA: peptidoglycan-binding protein [Nocardioides sp.]|uniref:L,D-transpeptidase family protein n=1 Tax=Nocardioides sp. TaxID=35761 RepID=UPI002D7E98FD|nr:peptidoglycan-binding protein [Nocardioides sp.]HET6654517.1 peptidoglycan-binding protein [Nocardioides sp.]
MNRIGRQHLRRALVGTTTTLAVVMTAAGASYGVIGLSTATDSALRDRALPRTVALDSTREQAPVDPVRQSQDRLPQPPPATAPEPVLEPGDSGRKVRVLQARLAQLDWFTPPVTGEYDRVTKRGVRGFQRKRGFERTGVVDARTWRRLQRMTQKPSEDVLFNRAGRPLFEPGDSGIRVRRIQARLRQIAWYFGDVTGTYGPSTRKAVYGFQGKRGIPQTGKVDRRTLDLLVGMTTNPTADELANRPPDPADGRPLDPRCRTGLALCIDKTSRSLRWVVDGKVKVTVDVRFGSAELPTREGVFSVYRKSRDHVSSLYHTSMPFAMFFSGGQAVHYSPDFAATGYNGASHGCVNVRDYNAIASLYDRVPIGTRVVIYWS